jgi:SdrD B-like domain
MFPVCFFNHTQTYTQIYTVMPVKQNVKLLAKLAGLFAPSELQLREIGVEESANNLVFKKTNGSLVRFPSTGTGTFNPIAFEPLPADTDAARKTWIENVQAKWLANGWMLPEPTYVISGAVSGGVQGGVSVELRSLPGNTVVQTVVTNGAGAYQFAPRLAGSYRVTPSIAGYTFTPANQVVTLAADTTQNFVSTIIPPIPPVAPASVNAALIGGGYSIDGTIGWWFNFNATWSAVPGAVDYAIYLNPTQLSPGGRSTIGSSATSVSVQENSSNTGLPVIGVAAINSVGTEGPITYSNVVPLI